MKYEVRTEDDKVILKLGLNHEAEFKKGASVEAIVSGVTELINVTVGVSAFDLVSAVMNEFNKDGSHAVHAGDDDCWTGTRSLQRGCL
jgi:hypothetical protein